MNITIQMRKRIIYTILIFLFSGILFAQNSSAGNRIYPTVARLNVRSQPTTRGKITGRLQNGRWVQVKKRHENWTEVCLDSGDTGYVFNKLVSDIWIKIWKKERKLLLMSDNKLLKTYQVALGVNPDDDKVKRGDGSTPHGRFFICEMLPNPRPAKKYGARSMRISYPDIEDARRGLKDKLISKSEYLKIIKKISNAGIPVQNTLLGGSIRIHGGGVGSDWTLGCVAMNDDDIIGLYSELPSRNTLVEIYQGEKEDREINKKGYTSERILKAAKRLLKTGCKYTKNATSIIKMDYPMGDFDLKIGVCTDVVIRSLREAGIDLQALLHEDIILNPGRYPGISKPDTNIDHRRTRNLKIWFDHHAIKLANTVPSSAQEWRPGDIVLMDTGIQNGTVYDHIGIVSDTEFKNRLLVINLWTVGYEINEMDLLNGKYPTVVGHYRLTHPYDYDALREVRSEK